MTPHGGSGVILDGRGDAATCWAELTMLRKEGRVSPLHWRIRIAAECARLESVYRETYRGFKSLILRQNVGNSPEVTSDENSYAELDDFCTIPDVPITYGYLTKITAERAREGAVTAE